MLQTLGQIADNINAHADNINQRRLDAAPLHPAQEYALNLDIVNRRLQIMQTELMIANTVLLEKLSGVKAEDLMAAFYETSSSSSSQG